MRRGTTFLAVTVVSVLGVGACGSSTSPPQVRTRSIPTDATHVVIRMDTRGGFTSAEYQLGIVPELTIYGDGRVIVSGPVTEQYPPHALPNLLTGQLSRATVVRQVRGAADAGLYGTAIDFGRPGVTDMPTTAITVNVSSPCPEGAACAAPSPHRVYALEFHPVQGDPGLSAEQLAARRRVRAWVAVANRTTARAAKTPYTANEVAVYVRPARPTATDGSVTPGTMSWPLGDLASFGSSNADTDYRCGVLTGADAATALAVAAHATSITRWASGGAQYSIVWRPLLPDEHACPGLADG